MVIFGFIYLCLCQFRLFLHILLGQFVKKSSSFSIFIVKTACPDFCAFQELLTVRKMSIFVQTNQKQAHFLRLTMCISVLIIHKDLICTPENERRETPAFGTVADTYPAVFWKTREILHKLA